MTNDFVFTGEPTSIPAGVVLTPAKVLNYQTVGQDCNGLSPQNKKNSSPFYAARANASPRLSWHTHRATFYPKEGQIWMSPKLSPAGSVLNVNLRPAAWERFIAPLTWDSI